MPYKCSVGGCTSGDACSQAEERVSMFSSPFDSKVRQKWLINLLRDDLKSSKDLKPSMRAKHFSEADFEHNLKKLN